MSEEEDASSLTQKPASVMIRNFCLQHSREWPWHLFPLTIFWPINFWIFFRAQQVFTDNFFAIFYGMYCGLIAILSIPSILNVLVHTNKSSSDMTAYKRYIRTIYHTLTWFRHDLKPGTKSWKSLEAVRKLHLAASRSAKNASVGMISQKDMAITQYGFIGFSVLSQKQTGVHCTREQMEDYIHFWRVLGHVIGMKDE